MTDQQKIGFFIKKLREDKGMTQDSFAEALGTSQSAVARIEKGGQNLTIEQLAKISEILERRIVGIPESVDFRIVGGKKLSGSIETNTSKNGAINMLCASLINHGKTILHGIPHIEEVYRYIEIMESIGVSIKWITKDTLEIIPPKKLAIEKINKEAAIKTRSFTFVGALIHHSKKFSFPHSGGCKMGERTNKCKEAAIKMQAMCVVLYEYELPTKASAFDSLYTWHPDSSSTTLSRF
jgi:UDP-N-acetylglucosamine 1-carboxyvinyltransferase